MPVGCDGKISNGLGWKLAPAVRWILHVLPVAQRGGGGGGDALGSNLCREECKGHTCNTGRRELGSSAPSLITQLFPKQHAISLALAPSIRGLPTPHWQLSSVGKQVKEHHTRAMQCFFVSVGKQIVIASALGEASPWRQQGAQGSPSHPGSRQCVSEHTDHCCSTCLVCAEGHPAREGVYLPKNSQPDFVVGTCRRPLEACGLEHLSRFWSVQPPDVLPRPSPVRRSELTVGRRCFFV